MSEETSEIINSFSTAAEHKNLITWAREHDEVLYSSVADAMESMHFIVESDKFKAGLFSIYTEEGVSYAHIEYLIENDIRYTVDNLHPMLTAHGL